MHLWLFQIVASSTPSRNFSPLRLKSGQVSNRSFLPEEKNSKIFVRKFRADYELYHVIDIQERLNMMKHGRGSFLVFSGFDGTEEELGLESTNFWLFKNNDMDKS